MNSAYRVAHRIQRAMARNTAWMSPLRCLSRRGMVPDFVWRRLAVACDMELPLPEGNIVRYRTHPGDQIGRILFWRGVLGFEPETTKVFLTLAPTTRVLLDVGANTGWYALICCAANPRCRAYCFEPVPRIFDALRANTEVNRFSDRCTAIMAAVADHDGQSQFHVPFDDLPTSACLDPKGFRGYAGALIDVRLLSLDSFIDDRTPVDLVKLDTEGFEDKALLGMLRILKQHAPDIVVECNPDGPYREVQRILAEFDYRFFHLTDSGPTEHSVIEPDPREVFRNYLCTARPTTLNRISTQRSY
jgi:FkbM family methyltransferase